ncbi:hypothetical protein GQ41_1516 [Arenibacter algicola]|uniref:Uncharacterized protein n=1 Tax=Arenibacter algicola TaxID=616991 RepID=A0ABY3AAK0_9FLAO
MDGGYYAIKGFEYQIDKSILEVLSCIDLNQEVAIEQIQDLNSESFVMQIKYKEATKLTPSVIRKPIIQLIEEFKNEPTKDYILYSYFSDLNGYSSNVDSVYLDNILGKESSIYSVQDKTQFLLKFKLIFSETFHNQFQSTLVKFQEFDFCNSKDEAIYYYSIIADYVRKKVVNNPPSQIHKRKVTKNEIYEYLANGRKIVFTSAFKEYQGEQAYFRLLKGCFNKPIKNQQSFIVIGDIKETTSTSISSLVLQIITKHYHNATYDIKPLNFIIPNNKIEEVKKYLIREESPFNDGFEMIEFSGKLFNSSPVINRKKSGNRVSNSLLRSSFYSRILSKSTLDTLTKIDGNPMWILLETEKHILMQNSNYQIINGLNTDQTLKLF